MWSVHIGRFLTGGLLSVTAVVVTAATLIRLPAAETVELHYPSDFDISFTKDGYTSKDWPGLVPKGQNEENWTLKLASHTDANGAKQDPELYFSEFAHRVSEQCDGIEVARGKSKEKAGSHSAYVGFIYCNKEKSTGKGEVAAYRMISGEDAMYIVKMAKRVAPFTANSMPTDINLVFMETLVRNSKVCRGTKC